MQSHLQVEVLAPAVQVFGAGEEVAPRGHHLRSLLWAQLHRLHPTRSARSSVLLRGVGGRQTSGTVSFGCAAGLRQSSACTHAP